MHYPESPKVSGHPYTWKWNVPGIKWLLYFLKLFVFSYFPVSIAAFGMLMGSLIAGPIANLIGRKWTCIFGTCGCLAASYALIAGMVPNKPHSKSKHASN